jgi:hypothetical protein
MSRVSDRPRTAWLFTRGRESVRMQVIGEGRCITLRVAGPGAKRAAYDFPDMLALLQHEAQLESHLVAQGYTLEEFISERRRWPR